MSIFKSRRRPVNRTALDRIWANCRRSTWRVRRLIDRRSTEVNSARERLSCRPPAPLEHRFVHLRKPNIGSSTAADERIFLHKRETRPAPVWSRSVRFRRCKSPVRTDRIILDGRWLSTWTVRETSRCQWLKKTREEKSFLRRRYDGRCYPSEYYTPLNVELTFQPQVKVQQMEKLRDRIDSIGEEILRPWAVNLILLNRRRTCRRIVNQERQVALPMRIRPTSNEDLPIIWSLVFVVKFCP